MTTHAEQRLIHHTPEQLFDLVADVRRYPEFLPRCLAARIKERSQTTLVADLIIGFQMFKEQFTSHVSMDRQSDYLKEYAEGPFKYLKNRWKFIEAP